MKHRHRVRNSRWNPLSGILEFFDNYFGSAEDAIDYANRQDGFDVRVYDDEEDVLVYTCEKDYETYA